MLSWNYLHDSTQSIWKYCIQMERKTCCLSRKSRNWALFWKTFNSYVFVSVDNDKINKTVLLRERKRHTGHRVASPLGGGYLPWPGGGNYLSRGGTYLGQGVPTLAWGGYVPLPGGGGTPPWPGGVPTLVGGTYLGGGIYLGQGGTPSWLGGYPPWPGGTHLGWDGIPSLPPGVNRLKTLPSPILWIWAVATLDSLLVESITWKK